MQEVSTPVPRLMRETASQYSDFNILSSLNSQVIEEVGNFAMLTFST